jgi:hypothetical protein
MKFIGQYIQSFIARFRNDVFLEDVSSGTIASGGNLGLDSNNKIVKATISSTTDLASDVTGVLPIANGGTGSSSAGGAITSLGLNSANNITTGTLDVDVGGTGATSLTDNAILLGNGTSAIEASAHLTYSNFAPGGGVDIDQLTIGDTNSTLAKVLTPGGINMSVGPDASTGSNTAGASLTLQGGTSTGNAVGGGIRFMSSFAGTSGSLPNSTAEIAAFDNVGNLQLDGGITTGSTSFVNSSGIIQTAAQTNITSVGTLTGLTTSGDVTIGGDLTVTSGTSGDATLIIEADTDNNNENDLPRLWFKADAITEGAVQLQNNTLDIINNVSSSGGIRFLTGTTDNTGTTDPSTGATERMSIASNGVVAINNDTSIEGNLRIGGSSDTANNWITIDAQSGGDTTGGGICFYETGTDTIGAPQYGAKIVYNETLDELAIGTMHNNAFKRQIHMDRSSESVIMQNIRLDSDSTNGPYLFFLKTDTSVADGDSLCRIIVRNSDRGSSTNNSQIQWFATEDHDGDSCGTKIAFTVTPNGNSQSETTAMTINQDSSISIPGTIELGHASDTTIARSAAGKVTIEGANVQTTQICTTHHNMSLDGSSSTADFYFPINSLADGSNSGLYYTRVLAAYDGKIVKIILRGNSLSGNTFGTSCTIYMSRRDHDNASYYHQSSGFQASETFNGSTQNTVVVPCGVGGANASDWVFEEGDMLGFSVVKNTTATDIDLVATIVWEYTV